MDHRDHFGTLGNIYEHRGTFKDNLGHSRTFQDILEHATLKLYQAQWQSTALRTAYYNSDSKHQQQRRNITKWCTVPRN